MKSITYKACLVLLLFVFICFLLYKDTLMQSSAKKEEITTVRQEKSKEESNKTDERLVKKIRLKKNIRKRMLHHKEMVIMPEISERSIKNIIDKTSEKYVTITNNITNDMLTYHHWTGKHAPTTFVISIDGIPLKEGECRKVFCNANNEIMIRYDYSFVKGYKTGSREIYFLAEGNKNDLSLTFSWHTKAHLILEGSEITQDVAVPFNQSFEI